MLKKLPTQKSVKAYSKTKSPQFDNDYDFQSQSIRNLLQNEIVRLERMIIQQTQSRESCDKELLSMIQHLETTKKSKLPSKPEISNISRLFSPLKAPKKVQEDSSVFECKKLLTTIKSEREFEINNTRLKLMEIQKQTSKINRKIEGIQQIISDFNGHLPQLRRSQKEIKGQLNEHAQNFKIQQAELKALIQKIPSQVQKQLKIDLQLMIMQSRQVQFTFVESLNKKIQEKTLACQNCIQTCLEALNRIENEATMSFEVLENKVRIASESIIETKQTIQQTIFGPQYRSKQKFESLSSLDCTPESTMALPRRPSQNLQKLNSVDNRVQILQRRMDLIYAEYLSRPFHKILPEEVPKRQ